MRTRNDDRSTLWASHSVQRIDLFLILSRGSVLSSFRGFALQSPQPSLRHLPEAWLRKAVVLITQWAFTRSGRKRHPNEDGDLECVDLLHHRTRSIALLYQFLTLFLKLCRVRGFLKTNPWRISRSSGASPGSPHGRRWRSAQSEISRGDVRRELSLRCCRVIAPEKECVH